MLETLWSVAGFIGFALFLLNYYGWYGLIPIALLILFRNKTIPLGRRVGINVSAGIIAPLSMIYPMLKHGIEINDDLKLFVLIALALTLVFSRIDGVNGVVAYSFMPIILGNVAVYLKVSPSIALPILFALIFVICDCILLAVTLRRTHESLRYIIGGAKLCDGLITLPGLLFLSILYVVIYYYTSPIIPAHYQFIKQGKYW